jgi:hypothetical protein
MATAYHARPLIVKVAAGTAIQEASHAPQFTTTGFLV